MQNKSECKKLGYQFKSNNLFESAFTHSSYQGPKSENLLIAFEYLEFLGDRILGMCVAEFLIKNEPDITKNSIKNVAQKHAMLVSSANLALITKNFELEKNLKHSIENLSEKVLADLMEAIIGAIYLDSDYKTIYEILSNLFAKSMLIEKIEPKMQLQELAQKKKFDMPIYETIETTGLDHQKQYKIALILKKDGILVEQTHASGSSKQMASKNAAKKMLRKLGIKT